MSNKASEVLELLKTKEKREIITISPLKLTSRGAQNFQYTLRKPFDMMATYTRVLHGSPGWTRTATGRLTAVCSTN